MKKLFSFLVILLFYSSVFAGVPDFLENWIFPENYQFESFKEVSPKDNSPFTQEIEDYVKKSLFTVSYDDENKGVLPPYFTEENLCDWGSSFDQVLENLVHNSKFYIYDDYLAEINTDQNANNTLDLYKKINIQRNDTSGILVSFLFPKKNGYKLTKVQVKYDGYEEKITLSPSDYFKKNKSDTWNNYSSLERNAIALSAVPSVKNFIGNSDFEISYQRSKSLDNWKGYLKNNFKISSKEDLYKTLDENPFPLNSDYMKKLKILEEYGSFSNILNSGDFYARDLCKIIYADEMEDKLGKHGIEAYDIAENIYVIRLCILCGYITKQEALILVEPYVNKALNDFVDYEDFISHCIAGYSFSGLFNNSFLLRVKKVFDNLYLLNMYVSPIPFGGTETETKQGLNYTDCWFEPSKDKSIYFTLDKNTKFSGIDSNVIRYDSLLHGTYPVKFFDNHYRKIWDSLPELEKYANAFSSNLFILNNDYPLDFECKSNFQNMDYNSRKILKDSWGITNYEELIDGFSTLQTAGHHGAYNKMKNLLEKYPEKSVLDISRIEGLSVLEVSRLYFVKNVQSELGSHGIEAWDEGRSITIMKWGVDAGYISKEEALSLIEPVVKKILSDYVMYDDYITHYIYGRAFYGLGALNYNDLIRNSKNADFEAGAYIPKYEIRFTCENIDAGHICLFPEYKPSDDALAWEKVLKAINNEPADSVFIDLEKRFPDQPGLVLAHLNFLLYENRNEEALNYIKKNLSLMNVLSSDNELYFTFNYYYLLVLNSLIMPADCLEYYESLPLNLKNNIYLYIQKTYANYLMANISDDPVDRNIYHYRLANDLKELKSRGVVDIEKLLQQFEF